MNRHDELRDFIRRECIDYSFTRNFHEPIPRRLHSGRWLFDCKKIFLQPKKLEHVVDALWEEVKDRDNYQVGGLESAAIPLVTGLVLRAHSEGKSINGFYVRKSRNKRGLNNHIEGQLNDDPIVLVDDLMNTSSSFMRQVEVLEQLGKKVDTVVSIVRFRPLKYYEYLNNKGISILSLFTLDDFELVLGSKKLPRQNPYDRTLLHQSPLASYMVVAPRPQPLIDGEHIYFGTDQGSFYALNKQSGEEIWKLRMGRHADNKSILSSAAVHDNSIFFGAYDGKFYAINKDTGVATWLYSDCEWIGSTPVVAKELGLLFVGLEHGLPGRRGSTVALSIATGEKKWEQTSPGLTHATPLYIKEHMQVCNGNNDGVLRAFHAETGDILWQFETEGGSAYEGRTGLSHGDIKMAPVYDVETDRIAFSSMDGWMYVVERASGTLCFRMCTDYKDTHHHSGIYNSPVFVDGYILFAGLDKCVYCIDKYSGELIWRFVTAGRIFAAPVIVDDRVFIGSNDGRLYELSLEKGRVLSTTQFPERITTTATYDKNTGNMYIMTHNNSVYRLKVQ